MDTSTRPLAIVTGASAGIGYHLSRECAAAGFDLLVAADQPAITQAAEDFRKLDDIISHRLPLEEAPRAYDIFNKKEDNCVKVVLKP